VAQVDASQLPDFVAQYSGRCQESTKEAVGEYKFCYFRSLQQGLLES